jgi:hypothetical protein
MDNCCESGSKDRHFPDSPFLDSHRKGEPHLFLVNNAHGSQYITLDE